MLKEYDKNAAVQISEVFGTRCDVYYQKMLWNRAF